MADDPSPSVKGDRARTGASDWLHRNCERPLIAGYLGEADLSWARVGPAGPGEGNFTSEGEGEATSFRHIPYAALCPAPMAEAAALAQEPTLLEAQELLFASLEWLIATRGHLLDSDTPFPELLVGLLEAFGMDSALHDHDEARLRQLTEALPWWGARRGDPASATTLIQRCFGVDLDRRVGHGAAPASGGAELFTLRSGRWLAARGADEVRLRVGARWVLAEPCLGSHRVEDLSLSVSDEMPWLPSLLRLLPVWFHLRPVEGRPAEVSPSAPAQDGP